MQAKRPHPGSSASSSCASGDASGSSQQSRGSSGNSAGEPPHKVAKRQQPAYPPIHRTFCESLPREVLERILEHLSIADIHNLRLSGAAARSFVTSQLLRKTFNSHVRMLQLVWRDMWPGDDHDSDDSDYERPSFPDFLTLEGWPDKTAVFQLRGPRPVVRRMKQLADRARTARSDDAIRLFEAVREDTEAPAPSEVAEMEGTLKVCAIDDEIASMIARELPSLKILSLWRRSYPTGAYRGRISKLPDSFALLQQLRTVDLGFQDFDSVPEPVLRLARLQRLHLSGNEKLSALPDDIGERLPLLQFISIDSCEITTFPVSLLRALERNMPDHTNFESFSYGVCAEDNVFPLGFWMRLIRATRYPKFARLIRQRCSLVLHHPGRDFVL